VTARRAAAALCLAAAAACSDVTASDGGIVALEIRSPLAATVEAGDTLRLRARALDRNGDSVAADITWRTPDATLSVDPATGLVTGVSAGAGRVQAIEGSLVSDFVTVSVLAGADTLEVPPAGATVVVDPAASVSPPLVSRLARFNPAEGATNRQIIYTIVSPAFTDPALRTVEITGAGLADTVLTDASGNPAPPVTLSRVAGQTAPASVLVEVTALRRSGAPIPGSGQRFTVTFP
jgi:hypothetical protein